MIPFVDPLPLAQTLLCCPSVTPADEGAQSALAARLLALGLHVERLRFGGVENLFARIGTASPHLCFAGHTDVVPAGAAAWSVDPFAATVRDSVLYGRGACDMKGAIAAFVAALAGRLQAGPLKGSISLLITGDEEGPAQDGTARVLEWMETNRQVPDFCLVGEPTNPTRIGEAIKIGRRGSLNGRLLVRGKQGHVAYPERADNPLPRLLSALLALISEKLDDGSEGFEPSLLQLTSVDVGNPVVNLIPALAEAHFNIRFNDRHTAASLSSWIRERVSPFLSDFALEVTVGAEPFRCEPGEYAFLLRRIVAAETGLEPRFDTAGGTSDARFIARYCPVAEFGLVGASMHQADECAPLDDLRFLTRIYGRFVEVFSV